MPKKKPNLNWADEEFSTKGDPTATGISSRHWEFRSRLADVVREAMRYASGSTGGDGGLRQAIRNLDACQLAYDDQLSALLEWKKGDTYIRDGNKVVLLQMRQQSDGRTEILPATPRRKLKLT